MGIGKQLHHTETDPASKMEPLSLPQILPSTSCSIIFPSSTPSCWQGWGNLREAAGFSIASHHSICLKPDIPSIISLQARVKDIFSPENPDSPPPSALWAIQGSHQLPSSAGGTGFPLFTLGLSFLFLLASSILIPTSEESQSIFQWLTEDSVGRYSWAPMLLTHANQPFLLREVPGNNGTAKQKKT